MDDERLPSGPLEAAAMREAERQYRLARLAEIDALIANPDDIAAVDPDASVGALWRERQNLLPYLLEEVTP